MQLAQAPLRGVPGNQGTHCRTPEYVVGKSKPMFIVWALQYSSTYSFGLGDSYKRTLSALVDFEQKNECTVVAQ